MSWWWFTKEQLEAARARSPSLMKCHILKAETLDAVDRFHREGRLVQYVIEGEVVCCTCPQCRYLKRHLEEK